MAITFLHNHTPLNHFLSLPSSSSLSSPPLLLHPRITNAVANGNGGVRARTSRIQVGPTHTQRRRRRRRDFLVTGFSIFPFLTPIDNAAFQVFASTSDDEHKSDKEGSKQEVSSPKSVPSHPVMSRHNSIGIVASSVLAALYSLVRNDRAQSDAMIEFLNSEVKEKEATIDSLKMNFEAKMLNLKEQHYILLSEFTEEKLYLLNQIESANATITALRRELQGTEMEIEECDGQIENLGITLDEAKKYNQSLEDEVKKDSSITMLHEKINKLSSKLSEKEITVNILSSSLKQKESNLENLISANEQTEVEIDAFASLITNLKDELLKNRSELGLRSSVVDDLSDMVDSLINERDSLMLELDALEVLYKELESSCEEKVARGAKLVEEKEVELGQVREKYERTATGNIAKQSVISYMTRARDDSKKMLEKGGDYIQTLKRELGLSRAALRSSRDEVSDLNKQLDGLKRWCLELEGALCKVETEFHHRCEYLQRSMKDSLKVMGGSADELISAKAELDRTKSELQMVSNELAMKKELEGLKKQASEVRESKRTLETNLEKLTMLGDEVVKFVGTLPGELEGINAQVSSLLKEKDDLGKALKKEKKIAREAREELKTAHNCIERVGNDKARLEKGTVKLEKDLEMANEEISRLKVHVEPAAISNDDDNNNNNNNEAEEEGKCGTKCVTEKEGEPATSSGKRGRRKRKGR